MSKHRIATMVWLLVCASLWAGLERPWIWLILLTFLYLGLLAFGSFQIGLNFYLTSVNRVPNDQQKVAITFDDGPDPNTLPVLEVLAKYGAKATFFCIGTQIEKYPEILFKIHEAGHQIGNHTYSHQHTFPIFSVEKMEDEINKTNILISTIIGSIPTIFRPPFGVTNPRVAKSIFNCDMQSIGWNRRSLDTVAKEPEEILARTADILQAGDIVLFHDRLPTAAATLEAFFKRVAGKEFIFERVDRIK